MGNGLIGWQSAGSFAWCGVSVPLPLVGRGKGWGALSQPNAEAAQASKWPSSHLSVPVQESFQRMPELCPPPLTPPHEGEGGGGACREKRLLLCFQSGLTR